MKAGILEVWHNATLGVHVHRALFRLQSRSVPVVHPSHLRAQGMRSGMCYELSNV